MFKKFIVAVVAAGSAQAWGMRGSDFYRYGSYGFNDWEVFDYADDGYGNDARYGYADEYSGDYN